MRFHIIRAVCVASIAMAGYTSSFGQASSAEMRTFVQQIHITVDADADRLKGIFKDIHQNAELGFMEVRTSGLVTEEPKALGFEVQTRIRGTGVIGILRNGEGPISGSDDAFAPVEGIDGVQAAYLGVGTAEPQVFAEARAKGHEFPFFVHEPNYIVDLNAIPHGTKIATLPALDVLRQK